MKFLFFGLYFICSVFGDETLECIQGDGTEVAIECSGDNLIQCRQPLFVDYVGMSEGTYGCGPCEEQNTCSECATNGCNTPPELGENFKCYNYVWNTTKEAWMKHAEYSSCQRLKNTAINCNMPGAEADEDYSFPNNGCGPCATDAANNTCVECDSEKCNESSAATFTTVLLPLIAVIYTLVM